MRAGVDGLEVNYPVRLPGIAETYRLDLAIPSLKSAIEYQSDYHRDPARWRRDMTRIARLRAHGWYVLEIDAVDLRDARELVDRLRSVIAARSHRP